MDKQIVLKSGDYTATIKYFGAELCSLKHGPSQTEFLWQADKSIWPRHSPLLFPFVGRLKNFEYTHNGKQYSIEQHGFARDSQFTLIEQKEDSVVFQLLDNLYTHSRYPFQFSLKMRYQLTANVLRTEFEISNAGSQIMPVSFGGHPAFAINDPTDAYIVFDKDLDPLSWQLDENFISDTQIPATNGRGQIDVDEHTFKADAMVFKHLESNWISLRSHTSTRQVNVEIKGWPYLGLWAKAAAKFICIEPWQGIADAANFEGDVSQKEGIIMLPPLNTITKGFNIEVKL